jgi:hypothetical protein
MAALLARGAFFALLILAIFLFLSLVDAGIMGPPAKRGRDWGGRSRRIGA